jgi:hypothetical protein
MQRCAERFNSGVKGLMNLEFFGQIVGKYSNTEFHENPFSGSRVVPCGQTDGRTHMTKLIVAFRNFANATKNVKLCKYKMLCVYIL